MGTTVEISTNASTKNLTALTSKQNAFDFENVRRPYRGIEVREDTSAIIKIIRNDSLEIPLIDAGARVTPAAGAGPGGTGAWSDPASSPTGAWSDPYADHSSPTGSWTDPYPSQSAGPGSTFNYSNFIIQKATERRDEKAQVVDTFGQPWIFFYGEKPRVLEVQGVLMNTLDFDWKTEFWRNYNAYLRGTRLAEMNARIYLYYDQQIVEGYMLGAMADTASDLPYYVPFGFTLFVTAHTYLGEINTSGNYPIGTNVQVPVDWLQSKTLINDVVQRLHSDAQLVGKQSSLNDIRAAVNRSAGLTTDKTTLISALTKGLADAESSIAGFMQTVKGYFYGRRMVVPRGLAGSEYYAGQATNANIATFVGDPPSRTLPLRSKIADNIDEYVGSGTPGWTGDINFKIEQDSRLTPEQLEKRCMKIMEAHGVDTTQPNVMDKLTGTAKNAIVKVGSATDFVASLRPVSSMFPTGV